MTEQELLKFLSEHHEVIKSYLRIVLNEIRLDKDLEHADKLYKIAMEHEKKKEE